MHPDVNSDTFLLQIRAANARVEQLEKLVAGGGEHSHLFADTFEELRTTLEELHVADAEMQQQNEELYETRLEVESERQRYRDLFDFAPDGYLVTDLDGAIREANIAAASMLGASQRALVTKPLVVFVPDSERQRFRSFVTGLPAKRREAEWETRIRPRIGETLWCAVTVAPVRDVDGRAVALRWLLRDITQRKRVEAQLRVMNAELEQRVRERTAHLALVNEQQAESLRREQEARRRVEARERDLAFLAEVGAVVAESLDLDATLHRVADLAVSHLADGCIIVLVDEGAIRRTVVAHRDPDRQRAAVEVQQRHSNGEEERPLLDRALRTGRTEVRAEAADRAPHGNEPDGSDAALLRAMDAYWYASIPLVAAGRSLGVLTLVSCEDSPQFGEIELALAEQLAGRAAMAVDNARLHSRVQRELADRVAAEQALARRQRQIVELNDRLRRSMIETHHRVKNNLQLITGLIDLSLDAAGEMVPAEDLRRVSTQVHMLARVHELLTESADEARGALPVTPILDGVLSMLKQQARERRVNLDLEDLHLPPREAASLALIVHELVSNALKHSSGEVEVTLKLAGAACGSGADSPQGLRVATLQVCDHGAGFPPGFETRRSSGVGIELVQSLSRWDLRGDVQFETLAEGGGRVTVQFAEPETTPVGGAAAQVA